jgi:hypothetical protein
MVVPAGQAAAAAGVQPTIRLVAAVLAPPSSVAIVLSCIAAFVYRYNANSLFG